jgi:hypothetical protein
MVVLALNTVGNFASRSRGEALLFGPLTLVTALACLLVAASKLHERFAPFAAAAHEGTPQDVPEARG